MQIVRESIFVSAIRSFFNTFLAVIGIVLALAIFTVVAGLFTSPYKMEEEYIEMQILPNAEGDTTILPETTPVILQVDLTGVIGETHLNGSSIESFLRVSRKGALKNNRVKAVLLYIDSPGGGAIDSDLIYQAVCRYKAKYNVPVYAYTPGVCASGGYMIACSADKIYASPSSIVGSVGAKWGIGFNFWQFMQTHGIDSVTVAEGLYKEKYPPFTKLPEGSSPYNDIITIVKESYSQFTDLVAKARESKGLTKEMLVQTYGAQIYSGQTGEKYGYVDNGNAYYCEVLQDLAKSAQLEEHSYQVVRFNYKHSPLQDLVSNKVSLWVEEAANALLGIKRSGKLTNSLLYYYDTNDRLK